MRLVLPSHLLKARTREMRMTSQTMLHMHAATNEDDAMCASQQMPSADVMPGVVFVLAWWSRFAMQKKQGWCCFSIPKFLSVILSGPKCSCGICTKMVWNHQAAQVLFPRTALELCTVVCLCGIHAALVHQKRAHISPVGLIFVTQTDQITNAIEALLKPAPCVVARCREGRCRNCIDKVEKQVFSDHGKTIKSHSCKSEECKMERNNNMDKPRENKQKEEAGATFPLVLALGLWLCLLKAPRRATFRRNPLSSRPRAHASAGPRTSTKHLCSGTICCC
jgi:hypothetical protein